MELIESIMSESNLMKVAAAVRRNKGAAGVDNMNVFEGTQYLKDHQEEIRQAVNSMKYRPQPVRRVYIPKPNGKKRGLGIPTVIDRTIQQATGRNGDWGFRRSSTGRFSRPRRRFSKISLTHVSANSASASVRGGVRTMPSCRPWSI